MKPWLSIGYEFVTTGYWSPTVTVVAMNATAQLPNANLANANLANATLVEQNRWLLPLFGASNPWRVLATVAPLTALLLWSGRGLSAGERLAELGGGPLYWSFFE